MTRPLDDETRTLLGDDAELVRIAEVLQNGGDPPIALDANFRGYLRRQLMAEADRILVPRPSFWHRLFGTPASTFALATAGVAAAVVLGAGGLLYARSQSAVIATSPDAGHEVATSEPIVVSFSGPVDHAAVEKGLRISPSTAAKLDWEGDKLIIKPQNPLADNTTYTVTIKPVQPVPGPIAIPILTQPVVREAQVITIVTRPSAPPRPVEISYAAEGLTFLPPGRLIKDVEAGTWAPGGQEVLFTRRAPSATSTPSASPLASPSAASPAPRSAAPAGRPRTVVGVVGVGRGREALLLEGNLPRWSPSGKQLAFWRSSGNANELAVAPRTAQGMGAPSVVATGDPAVAPVWLNEDSLALVSGGKIQVVRLTPGEAARPVGPATGQAPSELVASPDGRYLALIGADGIMLIELQGNIRRVFLPGAVALAWSSDGKRLAYSEATFPAGPRAAPTPSSSAPAIPTASASPAPSPTPSPSPAPLAPARLFVAGADGGEAQAILTGAAAERLLSLSWSPDGRALLFARAAGGAAHAWVVNADGSSPKAVANDLEILGAAWSPSGDHALYLHRDEDGNHSLWTQAISTTGVSGETQELVRAYDTVTTFLQARLKGDAEGARALLVDDAVTTFAGKQALLGRSNPRFARFLIVSRQATAKGSEFLVRVVQQGAKGVEVSYSEETLRLEKRGADYRIVGAQVSTTTLITPGPSVIKFEQQDGTVRVAFDSDLDTTTVNEQAIYVQTAAGARLDKTVVVLSPPDRSILLQLPRGLEPGSYLLKVTTQLRDANGLPLGHDYLWPFLIKTPSPDESGGRTSH